jgi:ankyrin repeat protein
MVLLSKTAFSFAILTSLVISGPAFSAKIKAVVKAETNTLIIKRNYKAAVALLTTLAKNGDSKAQYRLAEFYRLGLGTAKDENAARLWLTSASKAGNAKASALLKRLDETAPPTVKKSATQGSGNSSVSSSGVDFSKLPNRQAGQPDWLTLAVARKNTGVVSDITSAKLIMPKGNTNLALVIATKNGDIFIVQKLLVGNVTSDVDTRGQTPLMLAVASGNAELANALLQSKSSLLTKDHKGHSAAELAAANCQPAIFAKLIEAGAEADDKDSNQHPLILIAQNCSNWTDFKRFFSGANFNASDMLGRSAAWHAAAKGDESLLAWLADSGADLALPDKAGLSPLHIAAVNKQVFAVRYLLSKLDKADPVTERGTTPLMLAAFNGCVECISTLLEKSADLNLKNVDGDSSLMFAVRGQNSTLATQLIEKGANIGARNNSGETPSKLAEKFGLAILKGSSE